MLPTVTETFACTNSASSSVEPAQQQCWEKGCCGWLGGWMDGWVGASRDTRCSPRKGRKCNCSLRLDPWMVFRYNITPTLYIKLPSFSALQLLWSPPSSLPHVSVSFPFPSLLLLSVKQAGFPHLCPTYLHNEIKHVCKSQPVRTALEWK